LTSLV